MKRRTLEELNLMDDFLFQEAITRGEKGKRFCQILLRMIMGQEIGKVHITSQKVVAGMNTKLHGIRIDAYIEEEKEKETTTAEVISNIYDVEPNKYRGDSEPKRARYYHSLMDSKLLKTGTEYGKLKNVVIILITPYDPFGKDRMVYTVERHCVEDASISYEDGQKTIYLYTKGTQGNPSKELRDMLKYLEESTAENAVNKELKEIHTLVNEIKGDEEVGIGYMKAIEHEMMWKQEGKIEGEQRVNRLIKLLIEASREDEIDKAVSNREYQQRLFEEFGI